MFRREAEVRRGARPGRGRSARSLLIIPLIGAVAAGLAACGVRDSPTGSDVRARDPLPSTSSCSIPENEIFDGGVGRGGIPALTDPKLVDADHDEAKYLFPSDRVIGVRLDEGWVAVPHNILWWHEVVNFSLQRGGTRSVTYCPLTGSNLFFDTGKSGVSEFVVSGLLFHNNLMMLDPDTESIWPQMSLGARCGPRIGASLPVLPSIEMTWKAWQALHPDTKVISGITGFSRDYTRYPAVTRSSTSRLSFPRKVWMSAGPSRSGCWGSRPARMGSRSRSSRSRRWAPAAVAEATTPGPNPVDVVVLWDGEAEAAMAYDRRSTGELLSFAARDGRLVDLETGSVWQVDGLAVEGPLAGSRLEPIADAHVAFWFAWAEFHPNTMIWRPAN